jgi:hypothetical protein
MSLVGILIVIVVVGVCLYLVQTYVPMSPPIKTVLMVVVVLVLCLWLLSAFGVIDGGAVFNSRRPLR